MQCDICFRTGGNKLPFLCPTDARNRLYETRVSHAQVLLEKDALDQQISGIVSSSSNQDGQSAKGTESRPAVTALLAEKEQAVDRIQQIIAHADELKAKVEKAREDIAERKAIIERRKSELASATNGVETRRMRQTDEVEKALRMTRYKWNQAHSITASSRAFLCGEAAKLYGLRRVRRNGAVEEFKIGGISIVDLRSMNSATAAQISTALSHIVHLLILSTHYLAIRLPAEITLPHRDYPSPTIFPLASSHKYTNVPFPGSTPGHSSSSSPTASRHTEQQPAQPRPRPLFIEKPLPMLAAEDPAAYALFLEGVTLLAYNITWLCKSQGVAVGDGASFEDICNIGKNFFNLLLGSQSRPPPASRVPSSQSPPTKGGGEGEVEDKKTPGSFIGLYSHGTAHSFLGNADGNDFIRSWKLLSPVKLADKLKSQLMSELANAEWELLDQEAWATEDGIGDDDGVVVGARKEGAPPRGLGLGLGMQSFMSMRTVMGTVGAVGGETDRKPGTSGWTKLKPRFER